MSSNQQHNKPNQNMQPSTNSWGQGYPPSSAVPGYPPSSVGQVYPPPNAVPGYPPSSVGQVYPPPNAVPGYPSSSVGQVYPPPNAVPGYPPSVGQGYPPSTFGPGYPTSSVGQGYPPSTFDPGYPTSSVGPGYPTSGVVPGYQSNVGPGYPTSDVGPRYPPSNVGSGYPPNSGVSSQSTIRHQMGPPNTDKNFMGSSVQKTTFRPTLVPASNFNPDTDSNQIYAAFKGIGCNKNKLINILARRSSSQRDLICKSYSKLYSKSLIDRTKSELRMNFEIAVVGLLYVGADADAYFLLRSMKGVGTIDSLLCEIIVSRSQQQLIMIRDSYTKLFGKNLEQVIANDTSGLYRDGLLRLIRSPRESNPTSDRNLAVSDSSILSAKNNFRPFTEEESIVDIFCKRNYSQLKLLFSVYEEMHRKSILTLINGCFSKDIKRLLKYIYYFVVDPNFFVCQNLRHSIKKSKAVQLAATVITRSEIDLGSAIDLYNSKFGNFIQDITTTFGSFDSDVVKLVTILTGNG